MGSNPITRSMPACFTPPYHRFVSTVVTLTLFLIMVSASGCSGGGGGDSGGTGNTSATAGGGSDTSDASVPAPTNDGPLPLSQIRFFAYQIQAINEAGMVDALAASHYDMLVLEPTRTDWSSNDKNFDTSAMVERLKGTKASDGVHRKLLIAYIDIGEAEDWRWYWTWSKEDDENFVQGSPLPADWPNYIITRDPDGWLSNYPVAYWNDDWKDIVIHGQNQNSDPFGDYTSIIDEVIRDGFDGIYLDWVEGFESTEVMAAAAAAGLDPAVEMITFIGEMRDYARQRNPNFLIIQQNAASLIDGRPELANVIDAIAQEAIWFDGDATDNWEDPNGHDAVNGQDLVDYYLGWLDDYQAAGLPVFAVEYALENCDTAYSRSYALNFVPYCTRRSLGNLTTTPPPAYSQTSSPAPSPSIWRPALNTSWQWQLLVPVDLSIDAQVYDIDLFDNAASVVDQLHAQGRKVICYISAGSWESWRPDQGQFPAEIIGNNYAGWPGEKWLDIRRIDLLGPIMEARLDMCRDKGFDAVEPDNIEAYIQNSGFPLTAQDQIAYNIWLADAAHERGLSIGLKNDSDQVAELIEYYDWALTEECFDGGWCDEMTPFIDAGKAVFDAEYTDLGTTRADFCDQANAMNFNAILKNRDLDAWREACR